MKKEKKKNYNKKSAIAIIMIIVMIFLAIIGSVWLIVAFALPKNMANFTYKIGWDSYSCKLYERHYNNSKDINSLYSALNISYSIENYNKTITLFEKFHDNENYEKFVDFIDEENKKINGTPLQKSTLLNEDNALKNMYVWSLVKTNQWQKGFDFALNENFIENPTYQNFGNYLFDCLINSNMTQNMCQSFTIVHSGQTVSVFAKMQTYFDEIYLEFVDEMDLTKDVQLIALGNRIMRVGNNINTLLVAMGNSVNAEVTAKMTDTNNNLKFLIGGDLWT